MSTARFTVEKGIPIPTPNLGRPVGSKRYPFREMKIGDSFLIGVDEYLANRVRQYASHMKKRHSLGFTIRKTDAGYRCWRIA